MIQKNLGLGYGGRTQCYKFSIDWNDIYALGANATGNVSLFNLPNFSVILRIIVKQSVTFTGLGGTLTVSIGTSGSVTLLTSATADLVANVPGNTTYQKTDLPDQGTYVSTTTPASPPPNLPASQSIVAHFVSGTGNLNAVTAGQVDVFFYLLEQTTPEP